MFNIQNALGDGVDMKWSTLQAEPRFLSYMIKPKNHPEWSLELAMMNNENYELNLSSSVDKEIDLLSRDQ